jgi:hypothetical protein
MGWTEYVAGMRNVKTVSKVLVVNLEKARPFSNNLARMGTF